VTAQRIQSIEEAKPGPSTQHAAFKEMAELARLPRLLRAGTRAMRASKEWTPQSPGEGDDAYGLRLKRSFLLGKYEDVCEAVGDTLFAGELIVEPPKVASEAKAAPKPGDTPLAKPDADAPPELDDDIQAWLEDFDGEGRTVEEWLLEAFQEALDVGCVHCLSDHPVIPVASSLEEEQKNGARPYAVMVRGDEILQVERGRFGGRDRILRVNIERCETTRVEEWGERTVKRTLVLYAGDPRVEDLSEESLRFVRWEIFDRDENGKDLPTPTEKGSMRPHVDIPLDTFYTKRTGFLRGKPALNRLAEKNAEHWQSSSHQRYHLDFSRFAQLFRKAFSDDEKKQLKVGSSNIWSAKHESADMKLVETTGAALGAGRQHLEDCKSEMAEMALEPFLKMGPSTAAEVAVSKGEADSKAEAWAIGIGKFVAAVLGRFRRWNTPAGQDPKPVGAAKLRMSKVMVLTPQQIDFIKFLRQNNDVDQQSLLRAGKESGLLPAWLDISVVLERTKTEAPKLTGFPLPLPPPKPAAGGPTPPTS
jgi:hypothetical protein